MLLSNYISTSACESTSVLFHTCKKVCLEQHQVWYCGTSLKSVHKLTECCSMSRGMTRAVSRHQVFSVLNYRLWMLEAKTPFRLCSIPQFVYIPGSIHLSNLIKTFEKVLFLKLCYDGSRLEISSYPLIFKPNPLYILIETPFKLWNCHKDQNFLISVLLFQFIHTFSTVTVQIFIIFQPFSDFYISVYGTECWVEESTDRVQKKSKTLTLCVAHSHDVHPTCMI